LKTPKFQNVRKL